MAGRIRAVFQSNELDRDLRLELEAHIQLLAEEHIRKGASQEEAQRLGRILRPKVNGEIAHFYSLVTRDTRELDFAHHRQMFLTEQGYRYEIVYAEELGGRGQQTAIRAQPLAQGSG